MLFWWWTFLGIVALVLAVIIILVAEYPAWLRAEEQRRAEWQAYMDEVDDDMESRGFKPMYRKKGSDQ